MQILRSYEDESQPLHEDLSPMGNPSLQVRWIRQQIKKQDQACFVSTLENDMPLDWTQKSSYRFLLELNLVGYDHVDEGEVTNLQ